ncbi:hypothetical protein BDW66DRAFT_146386, partial [Aspergillus desertorum]
MNKEQFVDWWIQTQSGHSEHQSTFWDRKGERAGIRADLGVSLSLRVISATIVVARYNQLSFIREYASESERELQQEEMDERIQEDTIEISDNEEGPSQYNSKRRRSIEPEEEPDLPEQNTQRVSGRVRKRTKLLDGYEIYFVSA